MDFLMNDNSNDNFVVLHQMKMDEEHLFLQVMKNHFFSSTEALKQKAVEKMKIEKSQLDKETIQIKTKNSQKRL